MARRHRQHARRARYPCPSTAAASDLRHSLCTQHSLISSDALHWRHPRRGIGPRSHRQRHRIWPRLSFESSLRNARRTEDLEKYKFLEHMRTTRRCFPEVGAARTQDERRADGRPQGDRFAASLRLATNSTAAHPFGASYLGCPRNRNIRTGFAHRIASGSEPIRKSERPETILSSR
jgi:hypothetical protein